MNGWTKIKGFFVGIRTFFSEVRSEMQKVSYPSRDEVVGTTIVVVITSLIFALYLWLADVVIIQAYEKLFEAFGS